ncbi:MAG TPA: DUF4915 domain-containing protein [Blastocatellia bacterium]|nr:DUF4915 domain-containing protein [Blastocatellia bacterium]HMV84661.1 DUF4915 domain-containing protein [Blastocatellia bacterium]HMX25750.1 DUF4915 domain-containing protein [Blastocatellia bacterium]HMY75316.1 DUF4915 domain-containing protein [Blastocatellia bacterium]HMZ18672.1 DUF4915 domain-containing protein [Blastocatellia bacterium]
MKSPFGEAGEALDSLWARHHAEWRDQAQVVSQWREAAETDPRLLKHKVRGQWWETLAECGITLLVTREYEHLAMAMRCGQNGPEVSYLRLPHPSGLVADKASGRVYIASTRNPNQVYEMLPVRELMPRLDVKLEPLANCPLMPLRTRFYPGSLYMHDLALINGVLHANAVGQNAIVRLREDGCYERVWWPRCIETESGPVFGQNHIQLNSIAAGGKLKESYFSASAEKVSARRPGHRNFPVDKRGVIFSGATREPIAGGLTRPHSARLHENRVWVDNSGYGEVGVAEQGRFEPVARLSGWTRGLCFHRRIAFVGTSRVIPRFRQYAPGLDVDSSVCGVHALELETGRVLGSLLWPAGNQIFALDWLPAQATSGFPFPVAGKRGTEREKMLFYAFQAGADNTRGKNTKSK